MGRRHPLKPLGTNFWGKERELTRFLADIMNRVKCKWMPEILMSDVLLEKAIRHDITPTTFAKARQKVIALTMFHLLSDSRGAASPKRLSTQLGVTDQDSAILLKTVFNRSFVAIQVSTFAVKEQLYEQIVSEKVQMCLIKMYARSIRTLMQQVTHLMTPTL